MVIKLGNLNISKLYLGNTEVGKAYLGNLEVYSKVSPGPTPGGIYVENGNLIFPAGTIINVEDYSGEEPGTIEYSLADTVTITGADYQDIMLSDGAGFSFNADMEGVHYYQPQGMSYRTLNGAASFEDGILNKTITLGTSSVNRGMNSVPIINFVCNHNCDIISLGLRGAASNLDSNFIYRIGLNGFYLHDYGESTTVETATTFWGKLSDDDISLNYSKVSSTSSYNIYHAQDNILQAGHSYCIYWYGNRPDDLYFGLKFSSTNTATLTLQYKEPYSNYDKEMYVLAGGYNFGSIRLDIGVRDSQPEYSRGTALGKVKYNQTQGWYEVIPIN